MFSIIDLAAAWKRFFFSLFRFYCSQFLHEIPFVEQQNERDQRDADAHCHHYRQFGNKFSEFN